jgi:hypothetical protein
MRVTGVQTCALPISKPFESTDEDFAKAKKLLEIASKLEKNGKSKNRS